MARRCYPAWCKDRYDEEVAATRADLVAGGKRPARLAGGLPLGALEARLRGTGIPSIAAAHRQRTRGALVAATVPVLLAFPFAVWIFMSTGQHEALLGGGHWIAAAHGSRTFVRSSSPELSTAGRVALDCADALALVVVLTLSVLFGAWKEARAALVRRGRAWAALWWAPLLLILAAIGLSVLRGATEPMVVGAVAHEVHGHTIRTSFTYAPGRHRMVADAATIGAWVATGLALTSTVVLALVVGCATCRPTRWRSA